MVTLCRPLNAQRTTSRRQRLRPPLVGEFLIVLILVKVYDIVRSLADTREYEALQHGRDVLNLEVFLHLDVEHSLNHLLTRSSILTDLAAGWYQFVHLSVTLAVLACCYRWRPDIYRRARNSLVLVNLMGLVVFWLYPVAPPRLLPGLGFLDANAIAGFGQGPTGPVSPDMFAAMPSLHLAWATWTVIVVRKLMRDHQRLQRLAPGYAMVTAMVVVVTANHYLLDVVAGIAVCLIASIAAGLIRSPGSIGAIGRAWAWGRKWRTGRRGGPGSEIGRPVTADPGDLVTANLDQDSDRAQIAAGGGNHSGLRA